MMATDDIEMQSEPNDSDWIRIESKDGFSFLVKRKIVNVSGGTMRNSLDASSGFSEAATKTYVSDDRGIIVQKLLEYMAFKAHYEKVGPKEEVPISELMERIPPEIVLELLLAADYQEM